MSLPEKHFRYKGFIVRHYRDIVPYRAKASKTVIANGEQKNIRIDETAMTEEEAIARAKKKIDYYVNEYNLEE